MRFWLPLITEPADELVEVARIAEEHGFEGVALADHVVIPDGFRSVHPSGEQVFSATAPFPDPFVMVGAMATATTTLRFMSYVYVLPMRDPFAVAKQVGTAAIVSGGRVVLGAGAGWLREELDVLGHDPATRGRRMDEMLEVIEDFWADGWAEHHGRFYEFGKSAMFPVPGAPIPVWVGGKSDAALRRAARHDGWLGMNYDLDEVDRLVRRLNAMRGDRRPGFEVFVIANAAPSKALYGDLEAMGVTSTMGMPWPPGDPGFAGVEAKRAAIAAFAEEFLSAST